MAVTIAPYPLALKLAGHQKTGQQYLVWQLFRRPNHDWLFYPVTVPLVIGPLVLAAAVAGVWLVRRELSWRETLLLSWILVPSLFFQLWPVKGFQYLLPTAPAFAVLAGSALASAPVRLRRVPVRAGAVALVALSLAIASWQRIQPSTSGTFLAGSGGVPGGRELGHW